VLCSDIKSLSDEFYKAICPVASVEQVLGSIARARQLGIHVETRTNIIPGYNDQPEILYAIASWIHDHLGSDSPWHITRFFPAYKLSHIPTTPGAIMQQAADLARQVGLTNVYVYDDKGCDCAAENLPVSAYLESRVEDLHRVKKCSASCCGEEGILLKKYEPAGD
jgi:pyruvate formate lyase activating enzyme